MGKRYITELSEGERVISHFLVQSRQLLSTKAGKPYTSLTLQDKTGSIAARVWDNASEFFDTFKANDVIKVNGNVELYNSERQIIIRRLRSSEPDEYDLPDFLARSGHDVEEMFLELLSHVESIENPHLKALLLSFFEDEGFVNEFKGPFLHFV